MIQKSETIHLAAHLEYFFITRISFLNLSLLILDG